MHMHEYAVRRANELVPEYSCDLQDGTPAHARWVDAYTQIMYNAIMDRRDMELFPVHGVENA